MFNDAIGVSRITCNHCNWGTPDSVILRWIGLCWYSTRAVTFSFFCLLPLLRFDDAGDDDAGDSWAEKMQSQAYELEFLKQLTAAAGGVVFKPMEPPVSKKRKREEAPSTTE